MFFFSYFFFPTYSKQIWRARFSSSMGDLDPISKVMVAIFVKWCLCNTLKTKIDMDTIFATQMHTHEGLG